MTTNTQATVTLEQFAKDIWGALREDIRDQLGDSVTPEQFDERVPPWEKLSPEQRRTRIKTLRAEVLKPLDRAGYEVRKKV